MRTGLIDPVLLLVGFWSIYRAFGLRTALVSAVIWGANDFYMFGTCWAGATLRHDWMAYLAMGISALKLERWKLAGALLMLSGMIRAFPFFALVGAAMPAFWWIIEYWREHKRLPSLAVFRQAQRPLLLVAATATITGVVLYLASSLMFGFHSWVEWYHKVSLLHRDPHVNHVSLRALIAGPDGIHNRVLAARQNLFFGGIAVFALMVLISARGKDLARSAALGTLMIPVVFHPANYYIHFIFVLPMLVLEHDKQTETGKSWPISPANGGVWISLLLLVAAEYMCAIEKDLGLRFYYSSALLMITITAVLLLGLARDFQLARQLVPAMAGGGPVAPPVPAVEPEPPGAEPDSEPIAAETNGSAEPGADSPANDRPSAESDTESSEPERPEEPAAS